MRSWLKLLARFTFFMVNYKKKDFLKDGLIRKKGNMNPFSRNRKLTFDLVFWYVLDVGRETTCLAIRRLFSRFKKKKEFAFVSQQALSKARNKMNEKPFKEMLDTMIQGEYQSLIIPKSKTPLSRWGYHLFAIDGSEVSLPGTEEVKAKYKGTTQDNYKAVISVMSDTMNNMALDGLWGENVNDERALAEEHIKKIPEIFGDGRKNIILLFDRGYMSDFLVSLIELMGFKYCFRVRRHQDHKIDELPIGCDEILQIKSNKMRVVKFTLSSGELETICTNLFDIPANDFEEMYGQRWAVEQKFLDLKKRLEVENFRGYTLNVMKQDFYATLLADYFLTCAENEAAKNIAKAKAECKFEYKTNRNVMVGIMKDDFVKYFTAESNAERRRIMKDIMACSEQYVIPIRPGRSRDRKARRHIRDFHPNHKSNT